MAVSVAVFSIVPSCHPRNTRTQPLPISLPHTHLLAHLFSDFLMSQDEDSTCVMTFLAMVFFLTNLVTSKHWLEDFLNVGVFIRSASRPYEHRR